jgi:hypothetical protein
MLCIGRAKTAAMVNIVVSLTCTKKALFNFYQSVDGKFCFLIALGFSPVKGFLNYRL